MDIFAIPMYNSKLNFRKEKYDVKNLKVIG
jgi:hypothetical protein